MSFPQADVLTTAGRDYLVQSLDANKDLRITAIVLGDTHMNGGNLESVAAPFHEVFRIPISQAQDRRTEDGKYILFAPLTQSKTPDGSTTFDYAEFAVMADILNGAGAVVAPEVALLYNNMYDRQNILNLSQEQNIATLYFQVEIAVSGDAHITFLENPVPSNVSVQQADAMIEAHNTDPNAHGEQFWATRVHALEHIDSAVSTHDGSPGAHTFLFTAQDQKTKSAVSAHNSDNAAHTDIRASIPTAAQNAVTAHNSSSTAHQDIRAYADAEAQSAVAQHAGNKNNPHNVTLGQAITAMAAGTEDGIVPFSMGGTGRDDDGYHDAAFSVDVPGCTASGGRWLAPVNPISGYGFGAVWAHVNNVPPHAQTVPTVTLPVKFVVGKSAIVATSEDIADPDADVRAVFTAQNQLKVTQYGNVTEAVNISVVVIGLIDYTT